jgi:hypothetical protein
MVYVTSFCIKAVQITRSENIAPENEGAAGQKNTTYGAARAIRQKI